MKRAFGHRLSRRRVLKSALAGAAAVTVASPYVNRSARAGDDIVLATWETYAEDPWIEEFGKANGVKVIANRFGSVDEMFAKVSSGALEPDVIYIDTSTVPRYMPWLVPIDAARVPNLKNVSKAITYEKTNVIDGKLYALPYNWGPIPMMYRTDVVKEGTDTWRTLWDAKYTGRVSVFDDSFTSLPIFCILAGAKNPYNMTDAEFEATAALLRTLRPQIKAMTTGQNDAETLYGAGEVDIGVCHNPPIVVNLQKQGKPVAYSVPKEGVPSWLDCLLLTKKGDRDIVYKYLDANLSLEWQKRFVEFATSPGVFDPAGAAAVGVSPDVVRQTVMPLLDQPGLWDSLKFFQVVENADRRVQMWNDFKAGTL